jgi:hypothetical protein
VNEQQLSARLMAAFEPYLRGFCQEPSAASLRIHIRADRIDADATLAPDDFQVIANDVHVAAEVKQAFGALCRANDLTRGPSLSFVKALPPEA